MQLGRSYPANGIARSKAISSSARASPRVEGQTELRQLRGSAVDRHPAQ